MGTSPLQSVASGRALKLFFYYLLGYLQIQSQLSIHGFEPAVFFFQIFEALELGGIHAVVALPPLVKGCLAYTMLPADLSYTFAVGELLEELGNLLWVKVFLFIFDRSKVRVFFSS